ncbi:MAG: transcriptional regulator NrdR [Pirellulaceae bacterium]
MKCPFCQIDNDKVIDSRSVESGFVIRRRRECQGCQKRFTTYERVAEVELRVVKKDGAREPFSPDKIRQGLERALWKRPIPTETVENVIREILHEIYEVGETEIRSSEIGEILIEKLIDIDHVAYIRFASVYRKFDDIHDLFDEVEPILSQTSKNAKKNGTANENLE